MEALKATITKEVSRFMNGVEYNSKIHPICNNKVIPYDVGHSLKVHPAHCTCSYFYFYDACSHT